MPHPVIVPAAVSTLSRSDRSAICKLAGAIRAKQPKLGVLPPFGPDVRIGFGDGRCVIIGDNGEIPLILQGRHSRLDYRMGFLAGPGDVVIIGGKSSEAFQAYQQSVTGVKGVRYLNADPAEQLPLRATPSICLRQPDVFCKLARLLDGGGSPVIIAHITTGTIWALAAKLAAKIGKPVHVAGPPPRLSHAVNDKGWFGKVASRLLGQDSVPQKRIAHSASALTRHVADLAKRWDRLFLKVPDSAGSLGNFSLVTDHLRALSPRALHGFLTGYLSRSGWTGRFPLLVEVFDLNVLSSPSVQLWIPRAGDGDPVVEGLFKQVLEGPGYSFSGAMQARFPPGLEQRLAHQAQMLGQLFQELGYFGRCSFDAVVSGDGLQNASIHWIECNGRWGGVSIPMSLVNRLDRGRPARAYVIVQSPLPGMKPLPFTCFFSEAVRAFPDATRNGSIIFLSPNALETGAGLHALCLGATDGEALELSRQLIVFATGMEPAQIRAASL